MRGEKDGNRGAWGSVALAVALTLVVAILEASTAFDDLAVSGSVLFVLESLFVYLPVTAAVVAGQFVRLPVGRAAVIVALTVAFMLAIDFVPPSGGVHSATRVGATPGSGDVQEVSVIQKKWARGGAIVVSFRYLTGQIPEARTRQVVYPPGSAPWSVAQAIFKLLYMTLPLVGVGFVLGSRRWIASNVLFRSRTGERIFVFSSAWIVGPASVLAATYFMNLARGYALFRDASLLWISVPVVLFLAVAALGWRAAARPLQSLAEMD